MPSPNQKNRGSQWRKWDLHVHTPESRETLGDNWDTFVEHLIDCAKAHGVSAIATADYFTLEGYRKLLAYYNAATHTLAANGKSVPLYIVPGVELRLNSFNAQGHSINLHVFFDPDCSPDFLKHIFLEQLKLNYRGSEIPLNPQGLWAIGKSVSDGSALRLDEDFGAVSDAVKKSYVRKALGVATLNYADITEALKAIDDIFQRQKVSRKKYLVCVVGKGHGGISSLKWFEDTDSTKFSRAGLIREHLTHEADVIFSNDPSDRKFYLGQHPDTPESEVQARFSNLKPCVWGCDGDSLPTLLHPSNGNTRDYTWIKADASFEGLKQITYEPEQRVIVQQDDPSEQNTYAKVDTLELDFPDDLKIRDKESNETTPFCLQGKQEVSFSPNLTCVIGGRGSGKSTIVHLLFNLVSKRDTTRLTKLNSPLSNLQCGSKDELGKIASLSKCNVPANTEFFLQNEVEKFAKDISEMSALIRTRLYGLSTLDDSRKSLQQIEVEWKATAGDVDRLISAYDEITRIDSENEATTKQRDTLKAQTEVISSTEYKELQREIEDIATSITAFETYEKEYKRLATEISTLMKSASRLDWSKFGGQDALTGLSADLMKRQAEIKASFDAAKAKYDAADYSAKSVQKKAELKAFLTNKGLSPENIGELAAASEQIASLEQEIKDLQQERTPHSETFESKEATLAAYRQAHASYKAEFEAVASKLHSGLKTLKFDNQQALISFQLKMNMQPLKDGIAEFVKKSNSSRLSLRSDSIQTVIFGDAKDDDLLRIVTDKTALVDSINKSETADAHTQVLQELANQPEFVERMHLRMQRNYFDIQSIQIQTKLGDKSLQNTSFGERCGIVIAIALVAGTNPIIIDQPEDNLDGKYISTVLVPLIREQKRRRQIILVTRDANIVIGGDSELVLILDKNEKGTSLVPASIESQSARQQYIWILDGGEQAFQKREERYCITRSS